MGTHLILYVKHIPVSIFKNPKQIDSDSFILKNILEITVFHLFGKLPLNIA